MSTNHSESPDKPASASAMLLLPLAITVLALIISSLVEPLPDFGAYNGKRVIELTALALVLTSALSLSELRDRSLLLFFSYSRWIRWTMLFWVLALVISSLLAQHPKDALALVTLYLGLLIAGVVLSASKASQFDRVMRFMSYALVSFAIGVLLIEAMGFIANWSLGRQPNSHDLFIRYSHARFFNQLQSWLTPLLLLPVIVLPKNSITGKLSLLAFAGFVALLLFSGGRGSILSLTIGFLLVIILAGRNAARMRWIRQAFIAGIMGVALFGAVLTLPSLMGVDVSKSIDNSLGRSLIHTTGRIELWQEAVSGFLSSPWWGHGPGHYSCITKNRIEAHPHNHFFQALSEWGLIPTVLFMAWLLPLAILLLKRLRQNDSSRPHAVIQLASIGLIAAAIHSGLSGVLLMPASQMAGLIVCSLLLAALARSPTMAKGNPFHQVLPTTGQTAFALGLTAVVLVFLIALLAFVVPAQPELESRYREVSGLLSSPGFWQEGRICAIHEATSLPNSVDE